MKALIFEVATSGDFRGICLVDTWTADEGHRFWYSQEYTSTQDDEGNVLSVVDGAVLPQMTAQDLTAVVEYLVDHFMAGYTIYGWGTTGYDLRLLAEESGQSIVNCLAVHHIDLQFTTLFQTGNLYQLSMLAKWVGVAYNPDLSKRVPELWHSGNAQKTVVKGHVRNSVEVLVKLLEQRPETIGFVDNNGKVHEFTAVYEPIKPYADRLLAIPAVALKPGFTNVNWLRGFVE